MPGKYDPLRDYLQRCRKTESCVKLTFAKIEKIIGKPLPPSAYKRPAWWGNERGESNHTQLKAWSSAGYKVNGIHQGGTSGWVKFVRK